MSAGVGVVLLAAGCGSATPEIDAPQLSAADARTCRDLVEALPGTLLGEERIDTTGDSEYGAAWGDPAIVLTCGVDAVDLSDVPPCTVVDGVDWIVREGDGETTFTTDGYRPRVEVVVPDDYAPEASALTALRGAVTAHSVRKVPCV